MANEILSSCYQYFVYDCFLSIQVSVLMVMMNLKDRHRLTVCRMDIHSFDQNEIILAGEEMQTFSISVYQLSPISKLILENYTEKCVVGEKGEITLDTEIIFQERYIQMHQIEPQMKALLSYTCEIIRSQTTVHIPTLDLKFLNATCEYMGGLKCLQNFTFLMRTETDIFQLSGRQHKFLCNHFKDAEECLWFFKPCVMSRRMTGL